MRDGPKMELNEALSHYTPNYHVFSCETDRCSFFDQSNLLGMMAFSIVCFVWFFYRFDWRRPLTNIKLSLCNLVAKIWKGEQSWHFCRYFQTEDEFIEEEEEEEERVDQSSISKAANVESHHPQTEKTANYSSAETCLCDEKYQAELDKNESSKTQTTEASTNYLDFISALTINHDTSKFIQKKLMQENMELRNQLLTSEMKRYATLRHVMDLQRRLRFAVTINKIQRRGSMLNASLALRRRISFFDISDKSIIKYFDPRRELQESTIICNRLAFTDQPGSG